DDLNLETGQTVDLEFENRVGLLGVELEARHDLSSGVGLAVRLADDLQNLVERIEDDLEAFEDVDALLQRGLLVLESPRDDVEPEVQEVPENLVQREPLRRADHLVLGRLEAGQVDREGGLQR